MSEKSTANFTIYRDPPARIWRALTEASELTQWLADEARVDLREGGAMTLQSKIHFVSGAHRIVQLVPGKTLVLQWSLTGVPSHVAIELTPAGSGSRLEVRHSVARDAPVEVDHPLAGECSHLAELWGYATGLLKTWLELGEAKCRLVRTDTNVRRKVEHALTIDAPPEKVFAALTEPDQIHKWNPFAKELKVEKKKGGRYSFGWETEARDVDGPGEIVEYEQDRKLTYTWCGNKDATVSWAIEPLPGSKRATKLTLTHSGFADDEDITIGYNLGWGAFLHNIAFSVTKNLASADWQGAVR